MNEHIKEITANLTKEQRQAFHYMRRVTANKNDQNETTDKWSPKTGRFLRALFDLAELCTDGEHWQLYQELWSLVIDWDDKHPNAYIEMYETADGYGIEDEQFHYHD